MSGMQININGRNGRFLGGAPTDKTHVRRVRQAFERVDALAPLALTTHIKDQKLVRYNNTIYSVGVPLGTEDVDIPGILSILLRKSTLQRILIQDTTGYATPLNPFHRPCPAGRCTSIRVVDRWPRSAWDRDRS